MSHNKNWICIFLLFFFCFHTSSDAHEKQIRVVNIFSFDNGKGLENSRKILKNAIERLGHVVIEKGLHDVPKANEPSVDINIFFQHPRTIWYSHAGYNWLIPNPEYFVNDLSVLDGVDLIVCRTHDSERIFKGLNRNTYFLGFTSLDCYREDVSKKLTRCLHVAGGSPHKGTKAIIKAWDNSFFPLLTMIQFSGKKPLNQFNFQWINERIPENDLRLLQNSCGIHLCPSEIEGFGHYIVEGLSSGAIVITTDAPPMNEFIKDKRCLVPYTKTSSRYLGTVYFVDPTELKNTISKILSLPKSERQEIGEKNRQAYLQMTQEFHENLEKLFESIL